MLEDPKRRWKTILVLSSIFIIFLTEILLGYVVYSLKDEVKDLRETLNNQKSSEESEADFLKRLNRRLREVQEESIEEDNWIQVANSSKIKRKDLVAYCRNVRELCPVVPQIPGLPGIKGEKGAPGFTGVPGIPGVPGQKGEMGFIGIPGIPGPRGEKGSLVYDGLPGRDGMPGYPGQKGIKGERGPPGIGFLGQKGEKGEKGDVSPVGPPLYLQSENGLQRATP